MFRAVKKRKPRVLSTRAAVADDDDDDDDDNQRDKEQTPAVTVNVRPIHRKTQLQRRPPRGIVARTFDIDEDSPQQHHDDDNEGEKKKRRRRGMGYGGIGAVLPSSVHHDDEGLDDAPKVDDDSENVAAIPPRSMMYYGKDLLEQLKLEQRYKKPRHLLELSQESLTTTTPTTSTTATSTTTIIQEVSVLSSIPVVGDDVTTTKRSEPLPSYIPLGDTNNDSNNSKGGGLRDPLVVLAGDEAAILEDKMDDDGDDDEDDPLPTVGEEFNLFSKQAEESSAWEEEVFRRAGVKGLNSANIQGSNSIGKTSNGAAVRGGSGTLSSSQQIRDQIQLTLQQLKTQQNDLTRALERRKVDLTHVGAEFQRQDEEFQQAGQALEYYQRLRENLASWVGALRELKAKVDSLRDARLDLEIDMSGVTKWQDWEDDMIAVLRQADLLEQVLGRQPTLEVTSTSATGTTATDEFGRDVKSQKVLHREQRYRHRQRIHTQRGGRVKEDDSDAFVSDGGREEFGKRRSALDQAFAVAIEELDDEYSSIPDLVEIFTDWSKMHSDDYRQCFANLSLADLASVLVEKHLSSSNHPLHWLDGQGIKLSSSSPHGVVAFPWLEQLRLPERSQDNSEERPIRLVVQKVIVPRVLDLLDKSAYSVVSSKQSRSLAAMYGSLCELLPPTSSALDKTKTRIVQYLQREIQNLALPIIKPTATAGTEEGELKDALQSALFGQVYRTQKLLINIIVYWGPQLPDVSQIIDTVLDFCSSHLLFFLSSLQAHEAAAPHPPEVFGPIWNALCQSTNWLERPEQFLSAASIRAAAKAYGIVNSSSPHST